MSNFQRLAAVDMSAFEDNDANNNTATTSPEADEDMSDTAVELSNPQEQTRLATRTAELTTLQARLKKIEGWYADERTLPAQYRGVNLGFLMEGLEAHQAMVKDIVGLYESIGQNEGLAQECKEAGDSEGVEEAERDLKEARESIVKKEARESIVKKEGELRVFRQKYPDY